MSLEAVLQELNGNIVKLIDVMSKGAAAAAPAAGKTAEKSEGKTDDKKAAAGKGKTTDKGADKAKVPTEDDIRRVFGDFMRVDDEDEREKRKTYVKNVLKQYGVAKATDLKPEDRAAAISVIEDEAAKRAAAADEGEDDDLV